jgi:hypothetical protein
MPKAPSHQDRELAEYLARRDEFERGFRRSRKGNLWRHFEGMTLTVFGRDDGFYGWCIAGPDGTRFSSGGFEEEADAIGSLAGELEVGLW